MCFYVFVDGPRTKSLPSPGVACACADIVHPAVTMETKDDFRLTADLLSLHVSLKKSDKLTPQSTLHSSLS